MHLQDLLQNPDYKQKFVLEKLIQEYLWYNREAMRLHLDTEVNPEHLEKIQQGYNAYTVDKKPLEYILGHIDFFGVPFFVNEHTIIPRPETEYMITAVSEWTREQGKKSDFWMLLDIGTGSGILGISVLLQNPDFFDKVYLADISPEALEVAKKNYTTLIGEGKYETRFVQSNLLAFVEEMSNFTPWEEALLLVANLPYIPDETFDNNSLENVQKREPRLAFVGGDDGLELYRIMFNQIKKLHLESWISNLVMFLEMMTRQVEILKAEFGDWLAFEEVKTFHFNIRIVKARIK